MTAPDSYAAALSAARAELLPMLLAAEVRAASGGQITPEQAAGIVAPLNPAYFQAADGTVDRAAIAAYVAPLVESGGSPGSASATNEREAGRAEAVRRYGDLAGAGHGQSAREMGLARARERWPEKYAQQPDLGPGRSAGR